MSRSEREIAPSLSASRQRPAERQPEPSISIEPPHRWETPGLAELWAYREVLAFLAWRGLKVRYKQTVIGAAWAVLQPILAMAVFTLVFGTLLSVPSDGIPYPVFAFAALLPWNLFASGLAQASGSLVYDANLISKVYFPRLTVPIAATLPPVVDFLLAFVVLLAMVLVVGITPGISILALPIFLSLGYLTALAFGIWLSAINVKYRDIGHVVPFLIQLWLFLTPVAYPSSIVPEDWRGLYGLNPMVGVIEGFRWALFGSSTVSPMTILASSMVVVVVLITGVFYFRRVEAEFADVV